MEDSSEDLSSSQDAGNTPPPPKRKQAPTATAAATSRKEPFQHKHKHRHGHKHGGKGGERVSRGKRRHLSPSASSASDDSTSYDPPDGDHVTSKKAQKPTVKRLCQSEKVPTVDRHSALLNIFQKHYSNLEKMICVMSITSQLYSRNLISSHLQEQIITSQDPHCTKASQLLVGVRKLLDTDPEKIQALLEVLGEEPIFDGLTNGMASEYGYA